ncbi:terpenoid synthase [Dendrothele bispora CBS 962.96]|uniref:Terpene synthase n=1 Tax=Dendrothele bispora (strain CBS 962.96) TaxID=1314807 RepID=A0A4S8L6K9_DENBC|nr:terpenoid synthase [Dendrothele bispora CBS 962.96]
MPTPIEDGFHLPRLEDSFSIFPDHGQNPHYEAMKIESRTWIDSYINIVCEAKMCNFMRACNFELFSAFCYPTATEAGLRATMDLGNMLWLYDEFTDVQSPKEVEKAASISRCTLTEPGYNDGTWLCCMIKNFQQNHLNSAGQNTRRRLVNNYCSYVENVKVEASLREQKTRLDLPGYVAVRRESSATRIGFDMVEYVLGVDLPQRVHDDPVFKTAYQAALDLACWSNDLLSYNREQSRGQGEFNVISIIMRTKNFELQSAIDFVAGYCDALVAKFLESKQSLLSYSDPVFSQTTIRVLDGIGDWLKGHIRWSFVTERYFGKEGTAVKQGRIISIHAPLPTRPEFTKDSSLRTKYKSAHRLNTLQLRSRL